MSYRILSYGEVLWDQFPDYRMPGGSPANVAYHLHCLGNFSSLLSRIGVDSDGTELLRFLGEKGIPTDLIQHDEKLPTGLVTVSIDSDNEPSYNIHEPSAWDAIEFSNDVNVECQKLDAVCYASLSQRNNKSAETLEAVLEHVPETCLKVFDLNLRPPFINPDHIISVIRRSDVIKLNEDEFQTAKKWFDDDLFATKLLKHYPNMMILITRGAEGSQILTNEGSFHESAHSVDDSGDFVGVGDAFLACFIHLRLANKPPDLILKKANRYAAAVASRKGAMPNIPHHILNEVIK